MCSFRCVYSVQRRSPSLNSSTSTTWTWRRRAPSTWGKPPMFASPLFTPTSWRSWETSTVTLPGTAEKLFVLSRANDTRDHHHHLSRNQIAELKVSSALRGFHNSQSQERNMKNTNSLHGVSRFTRDAAGMFLNWLCFEAVTGLKSSSHFQSEGHS